jgi:hypothetical protein
LCRACAHWRRFVFPLHRPIASTFLAPFAPRPLRRFFTTMEPLTPGGVTSPSGSPSFLRKAFPPFCRQPPEGSCHRFSLPPLLGQRDRLPAPFQISTLAGCLGVRQVRTSPLNRRLVSLFRPNRVRYPADRWFTSGCSPPRLAATQLPSVSGRRRLPGGDFHPSDFAPSEAHDSGGAVRLRDPPLRQLDLCQESLVLGPARRDRPRRPTPSRRQLPLVSRKGLLDTYRSLCGLGPSVTSGDVL